MKNSEAVSIIINQLRFTTKDDHRSRRFILSKLRENTKNLITQKLRDKTLYREDDLYSWIECLQMEKVDTVKCDIIEFKNCDNLMKSVKKLPEIIYSRYGAGLLKAYSIDLDKEYEYITLQQYKLNKKRRHSNKKYFYIKDNYIYLPDSTVERINIPILTLETEKIPELNSCSPQTCNSIWDYEFVNSDKLEKVAISMTIQELAGTSRVIQTDENPNLNENQKGETVR